MARSTARKPRHGVKQRPSHGTVNSSLPSHELSSFPEVSPTTVPKCSKHQQFGFDSTYPAMCNRLTGCVTTETCPVPDCYQAAKTTTFRNALYSHIRAQHVPSMFVLQQRAHYWHEQIPWLPEWTMCLWRHGDGRGGGPTTTGNLVSLATGRFSFRQTSTPRPTCALTFRHRASSI